MTVQLIKEYISNVPEIKQMLIYKNSKID